MAMRNGRAGAGELTIALGHPNELFEAPPYNAADGVPPGVPGIERIRRDLGSRSLRGPATVAIEVPDDQATPQIERGIRESVTRYCDAGIESAEHELKTIRRDGIQTLLFGAVMLAGFLLISEAVLRSGAPRGIRDFFGNGLFLVAAWVGMWYPLDTLIFSGRPYRFERKLLRALREMEIVVRPAGGR